MIAVVSHGAYLLVAERVAVGVAVEGMAARQPSQH
jgi:hypothetical protein